MRTLCTILLLGLVPLLRAGEPPPLVLGSHQARYAADGTLLPWTSWKDALEREMSWYQHCPSEHGYPRFVTMTFMDGGYQPTARSDFIPATQNGMGIISYLKYYRFTGRARPEYLRTACLMADYLLREALTPDEGRYPRSVSYTHLTLPTILRV